MRLPFLQLESDLLAHGGPEVAILAGCTLAQVIGHLSLLRAWAVSHAGDDAPPDGMVTGEASGRRIEAAAQWTGERGALLKALIDAGQVEVVEGGHRVLNLEPYAKAWEQNAKAKERMAKARERSANKRVTEGESSAKFTGQTQTQTQIEDPAAQVAPAVAVPLAAKEQAPLFPTPAPEKPKRPPTAVAQWVETAVEARKSRVPADAPQDVELKRHQWPVLGEALKSHGALTLTSAFGLFLAAPGYPQEHAYPLGLFVSQVSEWVSRAQAAAAKARTQTASGGDRPRLPPREAPPESTTPAAPPRRVVL